MIFYALVIIAAFLADRLSKLWLTNYLAAHGTLTITNWLSFNLTYNRGVAFGLFQGIGPVVGWLTLLVLVAMAIYLLRMPRELWIIRLGLAFIVGGAAGNLIDRVYAGQVLDFITLSFLPWIFNVADIFIDGGMIIALIGSLIQQPAEEEKVQGSRGAEGQG